MRVVGVEQLSEAELEQKLEEEVERSYRLVQQLEEASSNANSTTTVLWKTASKVLEPSKPEQKDDLGASIEGLLLRADKTLQQYLPVNYNQNGGGGGIIPGTLSRQYTSFDSSLDDSLLDSGRHQGEPPLGDYVPKLTTRSATRPPGLPQLQLSMLQPQPPMAQAEHRSKTPKGVPGGPHSDALPPRLVYDTGQGYLPPGHSAQSNQMQQQQHHPPPPPPQQQQQQQQEASRLPLSTAYIQQPVPPLPMQGQQETLRSGPPSQPSYMIVLQGQPKSTINTHPAQQQQPTLEQRGAVTPRSTVTTTPIASQQQITIPRRSQQQVGNTQQQVSSTQQQLGMATTPRLSQHGTYPHNSPRPVMTQRPPLPTQHHHMLLSPRPLSSPSHLLTSGMRVCVCLSACAPSCARACFFVHAHLYAYTCTWRAYIHTQSNALQILRRMVSDDAGGRKHGRWGFRDGAEAAAEWAAARARGRATAAVSKRAAAATGSAIYGPAPPRSASLCRGGGASRTGAATDKEPAFAGGVGPHSLRQPPTRRAAGHAALAPSRGANARIYAAGDAGSWQPSGPAVGHNAAAEHASRNATTAVSGAGSSAGPHGDEYIESSTSVEESLPADCSLSFTRARTHALCLSDCMYVCLSHSL